MKLREKFRCLYRESLRVRSNLMTREYAQVQGQSQGQVRFRVKGMPTHIGLG